MPPYAIPYASSQLYDRGPSRTIGELLRAQQEAQAAAVQQQGQIAAQRWGQLGHTISGTIGDILQARQEAPIRAAQAAEQRIKIQNAQAQLAEHQATVQAQQQATVQQKALQEYFATLPEGADPDPRKVVSIVGPQQGAKLLSEWAVFRPKAPAPPGTHVVEGALVDDAGKVVYQAPAKPLAPEKQYEVTVPGPNGPIKKLVPESELKKGVSEYRAPVSSGTSTGSGDIQGNFDTTGDEFLKSIPVQWRSTVKKIGSYDEDAMKVAAARGGERSMIMRWVNQYNPGYDASMFANRAPTRKAYTTGTQGKQITNINTALGHIDQLDAVANQLQTGGFVPGNKAFNAVRTAFGSDKVTNFDTLKDALAGEVAGVLSQSGATVSGIADAQAKIHASSSPTQLAGYVKTLIPIMGSKLAGLDYSYHQAMGPEDTFSALSPESKRILTKHGFDPAHPTLETAPAASVAKPAAPSAGRVYYDANGNPVKR